MPYLQGSVIAIWEGPTVAKIENEALNKMVVGLWRIRALEEYNMFIFIKVLEVFTKECTCCPSPKVLDAIGIFV
jgi:hypothetical protein